MSIEALLKIGWFNLFENNDKLLKFTNQRGAGSGNRVHYIASTPLDNFNIRARHVKKHVKPYININIKILSDAGVLNEFKAGLFEIREKLSVDSADYNGRLFVDNRRFPLIGFNRVGEGNVRYIAVRILNK